MDAQIDYAVGLPIAILNDVPVADPATPSPGLLTAGEDLIDNTARTLIAVPD